MNVKIYDLKEIIMNNNIKNTPELLYKYRSLLKIERFLEIIID